MFYVSLRVIRKQKSTGNTHRMEEIPSILFWKTIKSQRKTAREE